jgi:ribonuclease T2
MLVEGRPARRRPPCLRALILPWALALLALVCLSASDSASARHHNRQGGEAPGVFSYYLLSLSWSPAFCLSAPGAAECAGPRRYGFIVHGLWPQNETGWPEHCNVHREVSDDVVRSVADLMPARSLIYHEWSAHGTCSGMEPPEYFSLLRRAYAAVTIPPPLSSPAQAVEQSPAAIVSAFLRANPRFPEQSVVVTCTGQDAPRLREVHVCLDRNLGPRACSSEALRGACRAPQLIIPPIR